MVMIQWRESYNIGIDQFDREHHKIVELIEILFKAIRNKESGQVVSNAIQELVRYTDYHFANEEKSMVKTDYPGLGDHYQEHVKLKEQVNEYLTSQNNLSQERLTEFYQFLREWLLDHIVGSDKAYGDYVNERNLSS